MRKLLALFALLAAAPAFATNPSQCVIGVANGAGATITISTGGDSLLAILQGTTTSTATFSSISDSQSQTLTQDVGFTIMADSGAGKYFPVGAWRIASANSGSHTITITGTNLGNPYFVLCEANSLSGFDLAQSSTTSFGTGTAIASGSLTPSQTGDLLISGYSLSAVTGVTFSSYTNSFVQQALQSSSAPTVTAAAVIDSGSTSINSGATASTSSTWGAYLVAYKVASAGTCTHQGITAAGALATPNGSTGSYVGKTGGFVTPNCTSVNYWQPAGGQFGVN